MGLTFEETVRHCLDGHIHFCPGQGSGISSLSSKLHFISVTLDEMEPNSKTQSLAKCVSQGVFFESITLLCLHSQVSQLWISLTVVQYTLHSASDSSSTTTPSISAEHFCKAQINYKPACQAIKTIITRSLHLIPQQ